MPLMYIVDSPKAGSTVTAMWLHMPICKKGPEISNCHDELANRPPGTAQKKYGLPAEEMYTFN